MDQVEHIEPKPTLVWSARAHLRHKLVKVCRAVGVEQDKLAVQTRGSDRQVSERLDHAGKAGAKIGPAFGVEPYLAAVLDRNPAPTIKFWLKNPMGPFRWSVAENGAAGADKAGADGGHGPKDCTP